MAKKTAKKSAKRGTGKRTLIKPKGDARYIRRDARGRIVESDDVGRSLKQDRARKAKTKTKSAHGGAAPIEIPVATAVERHAAVRRVTRLFKSNPIPARESLREQIAELQKNQVR